EDNTHYFPTLKYKGEKLEFQYRNASLICHEPAWLMIDDVVYSFEKNIDGKKLQPFLNKRFIVIPRTVEESYYQKFVAPLVESFDVYPKRFDIVSEKFEPEPYLSFSEIKTSSVAATLAKGVLESKTDRQAEGDKILFELSFKYGNYQVQTQDVK